MSVSIFLCSKKFNGKTNILVTKDDLNTADKINYLQVGMSNV